MMLLIGQDTRWTFDDTSIHELQYVIDEYLKNYEGKKPDSFPTKVSESTTVLSNGIIAKWWIGDGIAKS